MKALVGAFNQEKALVGAFSVIVQPVVEPMDHCTALPDAAQMEVVEEDGEVVVEAAARHEVELETPPRHVLDGGVLLHAQPVLAKPQLHLQRKFCVSEGFFNFG